MQIFKRVQHIQAYIEYQKSLGFTIGFVPTMGALHSGHLALVEYAHQQSDISVASIFVNPTQFNEASDLAKYPRTFEKDVDLLYTHQLHALFAPEVLDIYPATGIQTPSIDFKGLDTVLEGAFRPGHFAGVAQVVHRLLDIVRPDYLFMGQKDYQQWTIIHHMLRELSMDTELIMVPTMREKDGLAMSSRNVRLTEEWRIKAPQIHQLLEWVRHNLHSIPIESLTSHVMEKLEEEGFRPEYFAIVDGHTLLPVQQLNEHQKIVACVAAWAGDIRLIDNVILVDQT